MPDFERPPREVAALKSRKKRAKLNRRQKAKRNRDRQGIAATKAQDPRPAHEKPRPATICRDCQATNDPAASECWLCGRRDWRGNPASPATKPLAKTVGRARLMSWFETILIVLALAVVGAGIVRLAPGVGIAFLILLVPAWVITEKTARSRKQSMSAHRKLGEILWWTIVIPSLLVLTLPILLVIICTGVIGALL